MSAHKPELPRINGHDGFQAGHAAGACSSVGPLLGRVVAKVLSSLGLRRLSFRGSVGLSLLAGSTVFVLMPVAHAGRSEHHADTPSSVTAGSKQVQELLHDQTLAMQRNTHYLEQQARFSQMLLRLSQKTPQNPQQAKQIALATRADEQSLAHVDKNIMLSRLHLLATLPDKVSRVQYLLNKMGNVAPEDRRVAAFILFAGQRQQTVLDQLIKIVNQEQASTIVPGS